MDDHKIANMIVHAVMDVVAIAAFTVLMVLDKISPELGVSAIALIVGIWGKMQAGSTKLPPSGGLVAGLAMPLVDLIKRMV